MTRQPAALLLAAAVLLSGCHDAARIARKAWRRPYSEHCDSMPRPSGMMAATMACYDGATDKEAYAAGERAYKRYAEESANWCADLLTSEFCKPPKVCECGMDGFSSRNPGDPRPCMGQHWIGARCENGQWVGP